MIRLRGWLKHAVFVSAVVAFVCAYGALNISSFDLTRVTDNDAKFCPMPPAAGEDVVILNRSPHEHTITFNCFSKIPNSNDRDVIGSALRRYSADMIVVHNEREFSPSGINITRYVDTKIRSSCWGLTSIFPDYVKSDAIWIKTCPYIIKVNVGPNLGLANFLRNLVRLISKANGYQYKYGSDEGQDSRNTAYVISSVRGFRCFFSGDSSAPLSAQISVLVVIALIAGVQMIIGALCVVFSRRKILSWFMFLSGLILLCFLLWWVSPCAA